MNIFAIDLKSLAIGLAANMIWFAICRRFKLL